jgi:hypothetical protein
LNQEGPATPEVENIGFTDNEIQVFTSEFSGADSLMSVELQVVDQPSGNAVVLDTLFHWVNIYGVDESYNPIDKNRDQNFPNPFRDETKIVFHLHKDAHVEICIFDTDLRLVDQLQLGFKSKGTYQVDYHGEYLEDGIYYYTLVTDNFLVTGKMVKIF